MKPSFALALLPILAAGPAWSAETAPETESRLPAHTPEWTNPDQGDPGRTAAEQAADPVAGARIAPAQTNARKGTAAAANDGDSGPVRFGDGRRGARLPSRRADPEATGGDPDRPIVTGSVPNGSRQEPTERQEDDRR